MADETLPIPQQLRESAFKEFKRFIVIVLYLWVAFGLLSIHKSLVLSQSRLDYQKHSFAIVNAVLLFGEHFQLGSRFSNKALIYPVLHKCFVFTLLLISFHIVESVVVGVWRGNTIANSLPPMLGWNPKGLLAVGVMCFVVLLPFIGFREVARVMGRREMWIFFFERRENN